MTQQKNGFFSLERKLPILIGGVVSLALLITLLFVGYELRANAIDAARERLQMAASQLTDLAVTNIETRVRLVENIAAHADVVAYAAGTSSDDNAARAQLVRLRQRADSALPLQLRTLDGRVLDAQYPTTRIATADEAARAQVAPLADSVVYSELTPARDGQTFWTTAPVRAGDRIVGHIVQQRGLRGGSTGEQLERLLGSGIHIYFGNRTGGHWSALDDGSTTPASAPPDANGSVIQFGEQGDVLAYATPIENTPWMLIAQIPLADILSRPNQVVRRLSAMGVFLLLLGGLAAWLVSRSVTRPLRQIRLAADAIAAGDYSRRTELVRHDEIGTVAQSFDMMAERVKHSHAALEHQIYQAHALTRELESTNTRLNDALREADAARHEAQHANRAKSEFLATMSHEIRTPINAVVGYTDLMDMQLPGPLTESQREYVARIRRSAEHLTSLVNDVLDFAKVESGQMRIAKDVVRVAPAIDGAVAMLLNVAAAKHIHLTRECAATAHYLGDEQRVQQILLNLMSNAVKFTPHSGHVTISCDARQSRDVAHEKTHHWTCITVADTGPGIAPEQLDSIFEPFVQGATGYTRPHGGTGLGLAISRSLARMMAGDITVESRPGAGATFTLWLPQPGRPVPAPR